MTVGVATLVALLSTLSLVEHESPVAVWFSLGAVVMFVAVGLAAAAICWQIERSSRR